MKHQLIQEIKQNKEVELEVKRRLEERKKNLDVEETKLERRQKSYTVMLLYANAVYSLSVKLRRNFWSMWKSVEGSSLPVLKLCSL